MLKDNIDPLHNLEPMGVLAIKPVAGHQLPQDVDDGDAEVLLQEVVISLTYMLLVIHVLNLLHLVDSDLTSFKSLNKLLNLYVDSFFKTPLAKPKIF